MFNKQNTQPRIVALLVESDGISGLYRDSIYRDSIEGLIYDYTLILDVCLERRGKCWQRTLMACLSVCIYTHCLYLYAETIPKVTLNQNLPILAAQK